MDSYKILHQIGSGTYGDVYKVYKEGSDILKAVKISELNKGTEAEMDFLEHVSHPFIIKVDKIIKDKSKVNIIMELGTKNLAEIL